VALGLAVGCTQSPKEENKPMYRLHLAENQYCFDRLPLINPVFQKGFESMVEVARADHPFPERLEKLLALRQEILDRGREQPPRYPWKEEDVFLCCANDLLQGTFASEADAIVGTSAGLEEKRHRLQKLVDALEAIPYNNPRWRESEKPRIRGELDRRLGSLQ
jgi:hypothetical protein